MRHYRERNELPQMGEAARARGRSVGCRVGGHVRVPSSRLGAILGEGRLLVMQYEAAVLDPQRAVEHVWAALGIEPVPLPKTSAPSRTSTEGCECEWPADLRQALQVLYEPEVERLRSGWASTSPSGQASPRPSAPRLLPEPRADRLTDTASLRKAPPSAELILGVGATPSWRGRTDLAGTPGGVVGVAGRFSAGARLHERVVIRWSGSGAG
jgi:hypothetical protein